MTMGEFRKETDHIPDWWLIKVVDNKQILHHVRQYIVDPVIGDLVIIEPEEF